MGGWDGWDGDFENGSLDGDNWDFRGFWEEVRFGVGKDGEESFGGWKRRFMMVGIFMKNNVLV